MHFSVSQVKIGVAHHWRTEISGRTSEKDNGFMRVLERWRRIFHLTATRLSQQEAFPAGERGLSAL